jgi:hypothetical protein
MRFKGPRTALFFRDKNKAQATVEKWDKEDEDPKASSVQQPAAAAPSAQQPDGPCSQLAMQPHHSCSKQLTTAAACLCPCRRR